MPDYFVPLDTTNSSLYVNRLFSSNSIREFTLDYRDAHPKLKEMEAEDFVKKFQVSRQMIEDVVQIGEEKGLRRDSKALRRSNALLKLLIKAQIARDLYDDDIFYRIYNQTNETYQKGIDIFQNPASLQNKDNSALLINR